LNLTDYGYSERVEDIYRRRGVPAGTIRARVLEDYGLGYVLASDAGELDAALSGGLMDGLSGERPVAGDWVLARPAPEGGHAQVLEVMPRLSELRRADTMVDWKTTVVAANFDYLIFMVSMNANYSLNRIERLMASARKSGGVPVLVLSKLDLCDDRDGMIMQAESVAPDADVVAISSLTGQGLEALDRYFRKGVTTAVVGSSGVGKSTLLNRLMGFEAERTQGIREVDSKGRHTTTHRALHLLPGGGLFLDTPGVRSFGLTSEDHEASSSFPDIEELAQACRFDDCSHTKEPGCAVLRAVEEGDLEKRRYLSYLKMVKEVEHVRAGSEAAAFMERKRRAKAISKIQRQYH